MASPSQIDPSLRRSILNRMLAAVKSTATQQDPFPHIVMRDFIPHETYAQLLQLLPRPSEYEPFSYEKHSNVDGQSNRRRFRLENACLDTLSEEQRQFWYSLRSALGSVELKEAVFGKLCHGLAYRYRCDPTDAHSLPGFALPELFHETDGYRIKPHPDTRKKVVTMQFALPEDDRSKDLGTEFYRRSLNPAKLLREPKGFEIVKTAPFVPNTAYAFVVLNTLRLKSWHGRSQLTASSGVRNSILNIWYAKADQANQEIVAENEGQHAASKAA